MFDFPDSLLSLKPDRRREPRYAVSAEIAVHSSGEGAQVLLGLATVRDVSPSGLCVEMETRLPAGTMVEFRNGSTSCVAVCRHSGVGSRGYVMGFQVIESEGTGRQQVPAAW